MITTLKELIELKSCPICEKELAYVTDMSYKCSNNCYHLFIDNAVWEKYLNCHIYFFPVKHREHDKIEYIRDDEVEKFITLQERIYYWKKDYLYLAEILENA